MQILKWQLQLTDVQLVPLPASAEILSVQMQGPVACLWAKCESLNNIKIRQIMMYGTGHTMPDNPGRYLGTIQTHEGTLVLHVFEVL